MNNGRTRVLIIVENLPLPLDRRVWLEAQTLTRAGYLVSTISPMAKDYVRPYEFIEGVHVYRHPLPVEGNSPKTYAQEYSTALYHQFRLAWKIYRQHGFDVIQACNPPDDIFLVAMFYKFFFGTKFIFDHHDANPELYLAKFDRKDVFYTLMRLLEKWTYKTADVSIATNRSYKRIAVDRGGMPEDDVFVVRTGPQMQRFKIGAPDPALRRGRRHLVVYIGIMARQDGVDLLLEAADHIVHARGRDDVFFTMAGDGPAFEGLLKQRAELGLDDYVEFTGILRDDRLFPLLSTADVCVTSDRCNAANNISTMNKIMEYMAFAKPIVQFDMTEHRNSAKEAALYAKPDDTMDMAEKILTLIDDPELREKMGQFGLRRVREELSWDHTSPNLLRAYERAAIK